MKKTMIALTGTIILLGAGETAIRDWDNPKDLALGERLFAKNCAVCHGKAGAGNGEDWKKKRSDGRFPPPPLNGTAHTWHHSPELLATIIAKGAATYGKAYSGWMPGFSKKLSDKERLAILKYIHSLWPEEIRSRYDEHFSGLLQIDLHMDYTPFTF
ncbi:c-type cytochrome [Nitratifractor sp.]